MDIEIYPAIESGLKRHLTAQNYIQRFMARGEYEVVVGYEPTTPKYPYVKIIEVGNVPNGEFNHPLYTIANLRYKVDIYAKIEGSLGKDEVARNIAKLCNDYLTRIGLRQVSWNAIENDGLNGELYHIIIMYSANYDEQRQRILI